MIGEALRDLGIGLWRFFRYHLLGARGSNQKPQIPPSSEIPEDAPKYTVAPDIAIPADAYKRPVRLSTSRRDTDSSEFSRNPVFQIWQAQANPRAHKWVHYFEVYHAIFGSRRVEPLRILEIGVYQGGSLRMWRQYFTHPQTVIVGIDINPACAQFDAPENNIHVRIGSQTDEAILKAVARDFGPFDIIIDDGSHHSSHMITSFNLLFASALKDDGIYFAEDLHANYWPGYRDTQQSFLDLCKALMELIHAPYTVGNLLQWMQESDSESNQFSLEVPLIATMIKEIRVFDSIVAIQKTRREYLPRVLRPSAS